VKRQGRSGAARARRNAPRATKTGNSKSGNSRSAKTIEIVGLVEAISSDLGVGDGVYLGRGIARLLVDAYRQRRGTIPKWVEQVVRHYFDHSRES
jgi:hypothetical protein